MPSGFIAARHRAHDNSLTFMEPGEIHRNTPVNKVSDFIVLQMEPALIETASDELGSSLTPHLRSFHAENHRLHEAI
jgi:hypothetical protein